MRKLLPGLFLFTSLLVVVSAAGSTLNEQQFEASDAVVLGTVGNVFARAAGDEGFEAVYVVTIDQVLKGSFASSTVEIVVPRSRRSAQRNRSCHTAPSLGYRQEVLLLLDEENDRPGVWKPLDTCQDVYRLARNREGAVVQATMAGTPRPERDADEQQEDGGRPLRALNWLEEYRQKTSRSPRPPSAIGTRAGSGKPRPTPATGDEKVAVTLESTTVLTDGVGVSNLSAAANTWLHFQVSIPSGKGALDIGSSGGTGNAELFVNYGSANLFDSDYGSYQSANDETVSIANPGGGEWFISLYAGESFSGVTLQATSSGTSTVPPLSNGVAVTNLSGASGSYSDYRIVVPSGQGGLYVTLTGGTGDATLYLQHGSVSRGCCSHDGYSGSYGTNEESIEIAATPGEWFVTVEGSNVYSGASLTVTYTDGSGCPMTDVFLSFTGSTTTCQTGTGGTATVTHTGGGAATYQWGYYDYADFGVGTFVAIPGATGSSYTLNGSDFPGPYSYELVASVTPESGCGSQTFSSTRYISVDGPSFGSNGIGRSFSEAGGTASIFVSSYSGCPWTTTSNAPWITVTDPGPGTGNGSATISVSPSATSRVGSIVVAGVEHKIWQAPVVDISAGTITISGSTAGLFKFFRVPMPAGAEKLVVTMSGGTGDAHLFLGYTLPVLPADAPPDAFPPGNDEGWSLPAKSGASHYIGIYSAVPYSGVSLTVSYPEAFVYSLYGGGPGPGFADDQLDGPGDGSFYGGAFFAPTEVVADGAGNLFISDTYNHAIRKVDSQNLLTTFAGSGLCGFQDGPGVWDSNGNTPPHQTARFCEPRGMTFDGAGNLLVADSGNHRIRSIAPDGTVSTLIGPNQPPSYAPLYRPTAVAISGTDYIIAHDYGRISKLTSAGSFSDLADFGWSVEDMTVTASGDIYVAAYNLEKITPGGSVSTVVSSSTYPGVTGVTTNSAGQVVYTEADGTLYRLDNDIPTEIFDPSQCCANRYGFGHATGIAYRSDGSLFVADPLHDSIARITSEPAAYPFAGSSSRGFHDDSYPDFTRGGGYDYPVSVAPDAGGNVFVFDSGNQALRRIDSQRLVTTLRNASGSLEFRANTPSAVNVGWDGPVAVDEAGNLYYHYGYVIRKWTAPAGPITVFAGTSGVFGSSDGGPGTGQLSYETDFDFDASGNLYIADRYNHTIRRVGADGLLTTYAGTAGVCGGDDGPRASATFCEPAAIDVAPNGDIYVLEGWGRLRRIDTAGNVVTPYNYGAGRSVQDLSVSPDGRVYFLGPYDIYEARFFDELTFELVRIAGNGSYGRASYFPRTGEAASFNEGSRLAFDASGRMFIADSRNHAIVKGERCQYLSNVQISLSGSNPSCAAGGTATVTWSGGGVMYSGAGANLRWGYRTSSGGAVTWLNRYTRDYTITVSDFPAAGDYYLVARVSPAACGFEQISNEIPLAVYPPVSASITSGNSTVSAGNSASLAVTLEGTGPWTLTWSDHNVWTNATATTVEENVTSGTHTRTTAPLYATTTFTLTAVSANGCTGTTSGSSTVTVTPTGSPQITGFTPPSGAVGETVTVTGNHLGTTSSGTFGGANGVSTFVTVVDNNTLRMPVPLGATTGKIVIYTQEGATATSPSNFVVASVAAPSGLTATATTVSNVLVTWNAVSGATSYKVFRSNVGANYSLVGTTAATSFNDSTVSADKAYLYKVRSNDGSVDSGDSNFDLATTVIFTDAVLTPGTTIARAAHITELRTAVNAVRALAGDTAASFIDTSLTPGSSPIKRVHIIELRSVLDDARHKLFLPPVTYTDPTITVGSTTFKAAHVTDLRNGVK